MIFIKSFLVGGIICAIVQILIDKTKLTPGRIMVGLVCLGVIFKVGRLWRNSAITGLWK